MARDEKLIIRLTDDIKDEFQGIAESLGMTMSALGSFVVGDFVRKTKQEKEMRERMFESASEKMSYAIGEIMSDPEFEEKAEKAAALFVQNITKEK